MRRELRLPACGDRNELKNTTLSCGFCASNVVDTKSYVVTRKTKVTVREKVTCGGDHVMESVCSRTIMRQTVLNGGCSHEHVIKYIRRRKLGCYGVGCDVLFRDAASEDVRHLPKPPSPVDTDGAGALQQSRPERKRKRITIGLSIVKRVRRQSARAKARLMSESQKISSALNDISEHMAVLGTGSSLPLSMNCKQNISNGRQVAFFTGISKGDEERTTLGHVAVLWQTSIRPRRAVVFNFSDNLTETNFTATCSCNPLVECTSQRDAACHHLSTCFKTPVFMANVYHLIGKCTNRYREDPDGFEEQCNVFPWTFCPAMKLQRTKHSTTARTGDVIRTAKMKRKWAFWVVFDVNDRVLLPVLKESEKAFRCIQCRGVASRRGYCSHEMSCVNEVRRGELDACNEDCSENGSDVESVCSDIHVVDDLSSSSEEEWTELTEQARYRMEEWKKKLRKQKRLYFSNRKERALQMCLGEVMETKATAVKLRSCQGSDHAAFRDVVPTACPECKRMRNFSESVVYRAMRLCTVSMGSPIVYVQDWYCPICSALVFYTGENDGIFPASRKYAYTTELMYIWLNAVLNQGVTFRTAYSITCQTGSAVTTLMNAELSGINTQSWRLYRRGRRYANDALRYFTKSISLAHNGGEVERRLFSCTTCEVPITVEDANELGISLKDSAGEKRFKAVVVDGTAQGILGDLPDIERPSCHMPVKDALRRNQRILTIAGFAKTLRKLFSVTKKMVRLTLKRTFKRRSRAKYVSFSLTNPLSSGGKSLEKELGLPFTKEDVETIRLFLMDEPCFCETPSAEHSGHCKKLNVSFKERQAVLDLLRVMFSVSFRNTTSGEQDSSQRSWHVTYTIPEGRADMQSAESILEMMTCMLCEHSAQPYITPMREVHRIFNSNPEAFAKVVERHATHARNDQEENESKDFYAWSSMDLHVSCAQALRDFSYCEHHGRTVLMRPCEDCSGVLLSLERLVAEVNPPLSRFLRHLRQIVVKDHTLARELSEHAANCLIAHVETCNRYITKFEKHATDECNEYYKQFGRFNSDPIPEQDQMGEGTLYPARPRFRSNVTFDNPEEGLCNKNYVASAKHTPGLLTVQCACEDPKIIGVIVLKQVESISMALSSILSHFKYPPRVVFYDNGCNMVSSALLRVPWLLKVSRFIVDRFHYKSHRCSSYHDADRYSSLDSYRSTSAESFNARLAEGLAHMRYLSGENFLYALRTRCALLNLASLFKQKYKVTDIEEHDLAAFYRATMPCTCDSCTRLQEAERPRSEGWRDGDSRMMGSCGEGVSQPGTDNGEGGDSRPQVQSEDGEEVRCKMNCALPNNPEVQHVASTVEEAGHSHRTNDDGDSPRTVQDGGETADIDTDMSEGRIADVEVPRTNHDGKRSRTEVMEIMASYFDTVHQKTVSIVGLEDVCRRNGVDPADAMETIEYFVEQGIWEYAHGHQAVRFCE